MHHGPQRNVGVVAIVEVQLLSNCPKPNVGLLNGVIQNGETPDVLITLSIRKRVLIQRSE